MCCWSWMLNKWTVTTIYIWQVVHGLILLLFLWLSFKIILESMSSVVTWAVERWLNSPFGPLFNILLDHLEKHRQPIEPIQVVFRDTRSGISCPLCASSFSRSREGSATLFSYPLPGTRWRDNLRCISRTLSLGKLLRRNSVVRWSFGYCGSPTFLYFWDLQGIHAM